MVFTFSLSRLRNLTDYPRPLCRESGSDVRLLNTLFPIKRIDIMWSRRSEYFVLLTVSTKGFRETGGFTLLRY